MQKGDSHSYQSVLFVIAATLARTVLLSSESYTQDVPAVPILQSISYVSNMFDRCCNCRSYRHSCHWQLPFFWNHQKPASQSNDHTLAGAGSSSMFYYSVPLSSPLRVYFNVYLTV